MSFTGLFLITFLLAHLSGNLQLFIDDGGEAFNAYAYFMTTNPLVKFLSFGLYAGFLLHAIQGLALWAKNKKARGSSKYAVNTLNAASSHAPKRSSAHAALLGTIILVFLGIHMGDFWYNMKFTESIAMVPNETLGHDVRNLYAKVMASFSQWWIVLIYVISMIVLAFHLMHGFWSAFQTLGLTHKKYAPLIRGFGTVYSIIIPLAFAAIPVYMFIKQM